LADKAIIKKRGVDRNNDTYALENMTAQKMGFAVERSLPQGTLISGDIHQFGRLESEGYRVKILPDTNILDIGTYIIDIEKGPPEVPTELQIPESLKSTWPHHLVQCQEPPLEEWIKAIEDRGIDVVETISSYGLFIVGKPERVNALTELTFVSWVGPFLPAYRIDKTLLELNGTINYLGIGVYPPSEIESVKEAVMQLGGLIINVSTPTEINKNEYGSLTVQLNSDYLSRVACIPMVRWLEYISPTPGFDGERESQIVAGNINDSKPIPGYQSWLSQLILSGEGVTIAICDSGVDANEKNNVEGHLDIRGRQIRFIDYTNGRYETDTDGHGTHVAGICIGNASTGLNEGPPPDDFLWGQGIAPNAKYVNLNALMLGALGKWPPHDWMMLTKDAVENGSNIMNNSWYDGGRPGSGYTASARRFDQLCRSPSESILGNLIIIFSAGNSGPHPYSITPPHEAKNPIVVGNSHTFRPGMSNEDPQNDIRGVWSSSSRGPAYDGRLLPNIVAPGTNVSSAWSRIGNADDWRRRFAPGTEKKYMFGTGTSMAAPQISGCCALIIEWWRKTRSDKDPSLAMVKALLVNSAEDLAGGASGKKENGNVVPLDHIPNNDQGWGLVSLKNILGKGLRLFSDQRNPFTYSGQEHSIRINTLNSEVPLRITLVWTDAPGVVNANPAIVNDLDLEVTELATGNIYKGNVFSEGFSVTGGNFDNLNNIECVYIQNPVGQYEVRIIAFNVIANALPPFDKTPWQDYSLVIDNAGVEEGSSEGIIID
jgi:subtilisin family serine protease